MVVLRKTSQELKCQAATPDWGRFPRAATTFFFPDARVIGLVAAIAIRDRTAAA
jgi:hypothetical protein